VGLICILDKIRGGLPAVNLHVGRTALTLDRPLPQRARSNPSGDQEARQHVVEGGGGREHRSLVVHSVLDVPVGQQIRLLVAGQLPEAPGVAEVVDSDVEGDEVVGPVVGEKKPARCIASWESEFRSTH